jgi:hypothetical protein
VVGGGGGAHHLHPLDPRLHTVYSKSHTLRNKSFFQGIFTNTYIERTPNVFFRKPIPVKVFTERKKTVKVFCKPKQILGEKSFPRVLQKNLTVFQLCKTFQGFIENL